MQSLRIMNLLNFISMYHLYIKCFLGATKYIKPCYSENFSEYCQIFFWSTYLWCDFSGFFSAKSLNIDLKNPKIKICYALWGKEKTTNKQNLEGIKRRTTKEPKTNPTNQMRNRITCKQKQIGKKEQNKRKQQQKSPTKTNQNKTTKTHPEPPKPQNFIFQWWIISLKN